MLNSYTEDSTLQFDGEHYFHVCGDCDPSATPPLVHCPGCGTVRELTREQWHSVSCEESEEDWFQRVYGGIQWLESKKGGYYCKHNGMVMIAKQDKNGETWSTCAFLEEAEGGKPYLKWKNGHKTAELAKTYIEALVNEAKAVKLF